MHDRFSFTGHQSLKSPVSPQSSGKYLSWRTNQTKSVHRKHSLAPVAVKLEDVVCKTSKALLGLEQKKEPAQLLGVPDSGVEGGVCVPSPACKHFQMQHEPRASWCPWRRAPAGSGDLCSIPVTWEGMQRKLRLSALTSDSLPSLLCPEQTGCPGLAQQLWSLHSHAAVGMMLLAPWGGVCVAVGERHLQQRARKGLCGDQDSHILQKEPEWGESGKRSRGLRMATPFSDAALGRAQPYLQNREEEEDGVSHRKPGGQILRQLNHQDSLQISSKLARRLGQCHVMQAQGLWHFLWVAGGPSAWLSSLLFLKQDWYVLG